MAKSTITMVAASRGPRRLIAIGRVAARPTTASSGLGPLMGPLPIRLMGPAQTWNSVRPVSTAEMATSTTWSRLVRLTAASTVGLLDEIEIAPGDDPAYVGWMSP